MQSKIEELNHPDPICFFGLKAFRELISVLKKRDEIPYIYLNFNIYLLRKKGETPEQMHTEMIDLFDFLIERKVPNIRISSKFNTSDCRMPDYLRLLAKYIHESTDVFKIQSIYLDRMPVLSTNPAFMEFANKLRESRDIDVYFTQCEFDTGALQAILRAYSLNKKLYTHFLDAQYHGSNFDSVVSAFDKDTQKILEPSKAITINQNKQCFNTKKSNEKKASPYLFISAADKSVEETSITTVKATKEIDDEEKVSVLDKDSVSKLNKLHEYKKKLKALSDNANNHVQKQIETKLNALDDFLKVLKKENDHPSVENIIKAFNEFELKDVNRGTGLYRVGAFFREKRYEKYPGSFFPKRAVKSTLGELVLDFTNAYKSMVESTKQMELQRSNSK